MVEEQPGKPRRRHRSRADADQLAAEYEASGLTRQDFCRRKGVPLKTLGRYVARYRREKRGKTSKDAAPCWVAVEVAEPRGAGGGDLAVVLSRGRRIEVKRGFDGVTLRRLIMELERA